MELTIEQVLQQGVAAHNAGNLQEAKRAYQAILQSEPKHPDANHNLGLIAISVNQIETALSLFKTAVDTNPNIEQFWVSYINALVKANRLELAKSSVIQALTKGFDAYKFEVLVPQSKERIDFKVPAEKELSSLLEHYQRGLFDDAEKLALSLSIQFPRHNFSWKVLGAVLKKTGRASEAVFAGERTIELTPDDAEAHTNLGNTLKELGRLDEAEASYTEAIALKPDYPEAHNNLGNTLREQGRLDKAKVSYTKAIELKPDFLEAHSNLGVMFKEMGRWEDAKASYTKSIALNPYFGEAHYQLGVLWFERRQYHLAAAEFLLSNIKKSEMYSIQCSFLQEEESTFSEKFDILVNDGEINAVMGSLALRSELKYGIKRSNPFCSDPLSYVVKTDLNALYDFESIFVDTARSVLSDNSASYRNQGHLTNGVQTSGNVFKQGKVPETEIENIIRAEIEKYRIQFKCSKEGFITNWPDYYEIKGWLVCMQSGGKLAPHMHDSGWITGSIYINVPPKSKADSGNLVLCLNDQEHVSGVEKSRQRIIDVVTGSLCLFPSSLHHYTVPFQEKEERVVLAFDVIPKKTDY